MKDKNNNDHNVIPADQLPNPVSLDNDLHIKDEVFDEEEIKDTDKDKGVYKDEDKTVEDRIYPEEEIEDGTNPDHKVKKEINKQEDVLHDLDDEKKEEDEAMYPDESGVPVI